MEYQCLFGRPEKSTKLMCHQNNLRKSNLKLYCSRSLGVVHADTARIQWKQTTHTQQFISPWCACLRNCSTKFRASSLVKASTAFSQYASSLPGNSRMQGPRLRAQLRNNAVVFPWHPRPARYCSELCLAQLHHGTPTYEKVIVMVHGFTTGLPCFFTICWSLRLIDEGYT